MPSVATGLGLDLVLAGSKASIFTSAFPSHKTGNNSHPKILGYQGKHGVEYTADKCESQVGDLRKREGLLTKGTLRDTLLGLTNGGLPNLKHRFGKSEIPASSGRHGSGHGPPKHQYTNRQKHLLENDGNNLPNKTPVLNYTISTDAPVSKGQNSKRLGLSLLQQEHSSKPILTRPRSSQVELSKHQEEVNCSRELVQRHASETRLSQEKDSDSFDPQGNIYHSSPAKIHIKSPESLNWTLPPPVCDKSESSEVLNNSLRLRPNAPEPDPSPSPRSPRLDSSSSNDQLLSANREYIDIVAKENQAFKNELNRSLSRLLQRAVKSAGPVSQEEVQNLRAQFKESQHDKSQVRDSPVSGSPRGSPEEDSPFNASCRRRSLHSEDSGISSETIERDRELQTQAGRATSDTPNSKSNKGRRSRKQKTEMLADDPFNVLKTRRKKSSKSRKRKSGKKSRQKSRQDSSSGTQKKKITREEITNLTPRKDDRPSNIQLLNFQAYCSPMQVLPASFKPKPERQQVPLPQFPIKAHTTAIYNKKLPRVPPPTLTYDPNFLKESHSKSQFDVAQSYPTHRKGLSLKATTITTQDARKSFTESLRYHTSHGGGQSEENHKLTKVYLSEKQSGVLNELGIDLPCAPPVTPMPEILKRIEYIPSMFDIRAQRAVKSKLEVLERQEIKRKEKLMAQQVKNDKLSQKEKEKNKKKQQRLQVYALNKIMTELEHAGFEQFCKINGIECEL